LIVVGAGCLLLLETRGGETSGSVEEPAVVTWLVRSERGQCTHKKVRCGLVEHCPTARDFIWVHSRRQGVVLATFEEGPNTPTLLRDGFLGDHASQVSTSPAPSHVT